MDQSEKKTWYNLSKRSLSIIAASVAVLSGNKTTAAPIVESGIVSGNHNEASFKRILKPKLLLRLNMANPALSTTFMHTSHSSHSSHASHASHSSHASSSPTYTPSTYTPPAPAIRVAPVVRQQAVPNDYSLAVDTARTLYKGLKGEDVKLMQQLLKDKGYAVPVSGYFGLQTEVAVKKFQKLNDLPADGKVGSLTLSMMKGQ